MSIEPVALTGRETVVGEFEPGDRVVDAKAIPARSAAVSERDAPSVAVVVESTGETAGDVIAKGDKTVADYNPDIENIEDDLVVRVAFIGGAKGLDATTGKAWRDWPPAELSARLASFREEWSVGPMVYSYPETRLVPESTVDFGRFV